MHFRGWTATPRLPYVLSGNALCMPVPGYTTLLGLIGCCLGRIVEHHEVRLGFQYKYDYTNMDIETRQRLIYKNKKVKKQNKGPDAYRREFHSNPELTLWLNRIDWLASFQKPEGTPALGQSQDLLSISKAHVVQAEQVLKGKIKGTLLPYIGNEQAHGQLISMAEAYTENDTIGSGRSPVSSKIFLAIPPDAEVEVEDDHLYQIGNSNTIYLHDFDE